MFFVGLGGSGGKALRFLKRDFTEWCTQNGWFDAEAMGEQKSELPFGVQFLNIDTPAIQDGIAAGGPLLSDREYRGLVSRGMTMKSLTAQVDNGDRGGQSLVGWRVSPDTRVRVSDAGGQMRAVGRMISRAYAASVQNSLTGALDAIQSERATNEMQELYTVVHGAARGGVTDDPSTEPPVTVFVSSLAGGTGAGLIFDVVDIYRSLEPDLMDLTVGIWFTPDAFPEAFGAGLRPNALAAMSEMLNGAWWQPRDSTSARGVAIPVRDTGALQAAAGLPNAIDRSGVWVNYLVGQTNISGGRMDTDSRLFEKVGGALLSWIVDPELNDRLVSKVWGNYETNREQENGDLPWSYGTNAASMDSSGVPIFDALGFSRVSLGTRYLARYSVERLGRRVVDHLVRAQFESDWAKNAKQASGLTSPAQVNEFIARQRFAVYRDILDAGGALSEPELRALISNVRADAEQEEGLGGIYGRMLEKALEPEVLKERKNAKIDDLVQYAEQLDPMPISDWADQIVPMINEDVREALRQAVTDALPGHIQGWADEVSRRTVARAEDAIGTYGLEVAQAILDMLSLEIRDIVLPALQRLEEESAYTGSRKSVLDDFVESLGGGFGDNRKASASEVAVAIRAAVNAVSFSASAEVLRQTRLLVERYRDGLLRPIITQIGQASSRLDARYSETKFFPLNSDSALPPKHVLPPQSESTVIENEDFGSIFGQLIRETFRDLPPAQAEDAVVAELASGRFARTKLEAGLSDDDPFRGDFERAQVIDIQRNWSVGFDLVDGRDAASPATVEVRTEIEHVLERCELWLKRPRFPFGEFLAMDLRSYSDGDKTRQQRVLARLKEAVATAQPLVELYDDTVGIVHPKNMRDATQRVRFSITKVPFSNSSIEKEVRELLRSRIYANESEGEKDEAINKALSDTAELPYIDIVSWLSTPVSPIVAKTLMEPLVESWTGAKDDPSLRRHYWRNRRARPLGEFIPLPQAQLIAALRGWYTGRILGLIDVGDPVQPPFRILGGSQSEDPRWFKFPEQFLSEIVDSNDLGAIVLESLPLAIIFAHRTSGESLKAYTELVKLGMSDSKDRVSEVFEYPKPHEMICQWIDHGQIELQGETPLASLIVPEANPEARKQQLLETFNSNREAFASEHTSYFAREVVRSRDKLNAPPLWPGLHWQIDAAHAMLVVGVSAYEPGSGSQQAKKAGGPRIG